MPFAPHSKRKKVLTVNNKRLGDSFENELAQILFRNGFWVYVTKSKIGGQPADIIAAKDGIAYLIDCKVCSDNTFDTERIEENQKNAMSLFNKCGNGRGIFALKMPDGAIFMLGCHIALHHRQDKRSMNREEIEESTHTLKQWIERCSL